MSDHRPFTVIIAHRYEVVRVGIRRILSTSPTLEVVADAQDGPHLIDYVRALQPDVVIIDANVDHLDSAEIARIIAADAPSTRMILWCERHASETIRAALANGYHGILTDDVSASELVHLVVEAAHGVTALSPVAGQILQQAAVPVATPTAHLTAREREIIHMVARGLTSQQIGLELFISPRTVETHRARIMDKIGVNNAAALVRFAFDYSDYFELGSTSREP